MVEKDEIHRAFDDLRTAKIELGEISEADLAAREVLKRRESELLLSGAIIGKNAETRDAQLKEGCKEELAKAEDTRARKQNSVLVFELASMRVDEIKWLIRLEEVGKEKA